MHGAMTDSRDESGEAFQVVMDGYGAFSAPYIDQNEAKERADELQRECPGEQFHVESWPNHRQEKSDEVSA